MIAVVGHGQREPVEPLVVLLPELLPAEPDALPEPLVLPVPEVEPVEPAPVSVLTVPLTEPEVVVLPGVVEDVVVVVSVELGVVVVVVELGLVLVTVLLEPGVALVPELLALVLAPLLQPAMPAEARAMAAI